MKASPQFIRAMTSFIAGSVFFLLVSMGSPELALAQAGTASGSGSSGGSSGDSGSGGGRAAGDPCYRLTSSECQALAAKKRLAGENQAEVTVAPQPSEQPPAEQVSPNLQKPPATGKVSIAVGDIDGDSQEASADGDLILGSLESLSVAPAADELIVRPDEAIRSVEFLMGLVIAAGASFLPFFIFSNRRKESEK